KVHRDQVWSGLIRLCKHGSLRTRPAGQEALALLGGAGEWDAADCDLVLLEQLVELGAFGIMAECEAAVDFGLVLALRCEVSQKVIERVDRAGVLFAEL